VGRHGEPSRHAPEQFAGFQAHCQFLSTSVLVRTDEII
jgi:hypothetical protein